WHSPSPRRGGAPAPLRHATRSSRAQEGVRVRRETRAADDGYRCGLVPGLRASADAGRPADELALAAAPRPAPPARPPDPLGEIRERAGADIEAATWACFLLVYLSPLEGEDPFGGIRAALAAIPPPPAAAANGDGAPAAWPGSADLEAIPLGVRSSHAPGR